ncbi:thiolase family protein [Oceaniglobus ichthyenteri]|uniref:thiolase family protein n=1 Tax=Oceaniglobus ichthyenteri TaxID=2136177 RepID=UPI000D3368D5|nr:thiolase family protein [Oceaniglobus ichthyenteri]
MKGKTAIAGVGRTPYSRAKPDERILTVDEYIAWAAELALESAGMSKKDFDGQGFAVSHAEAAHTVNWASATAENLGLSPKSILRGDQGGASAASLLVRASAMIEAGVVDRFLIVGADTPLTIPSIAPGLPLSPERTRGVYWDFQGPFGVMGATAQFAMSQRRYMEQAGITEQQLGKIASTTRYHASLNPGAIYRTPYDVEEYMASRMLSDPIRLYDCVPMVNGGLAYIVTSAKTARAAVERPAFMLGHAELNNYYAGPRSHPDITGTGFIETGPEAFAMAGITPKDVDVFLPYDDYPFVVMLQLEHYGFCKRGEGGQYVENTDFTFRGDLPLSTDGGQLSGGQPGGAIGGFMPIVEAVTQIRGEGGERQVKDAQIALASGFGGITYGRNARSCVSIVFGQEG